MWEILYYFIYQLMQALVSSNNTLPDDDD